MERQWNQREEIMDDDLTAGAGKRGQSVGVLQEKCGIAKEEAKRQVDKLKNIVEQFKNPIAS